MERLSPDSPQKCPQRIAVVGTTGSGKTTLARQLADRLTIPHVELDAIHWEPNWTEIPTPLFRERLTPALSGNSWVVDGNYSQVRDIIWSRADTVVWLDYSLPVVLHRLVRRTFRRVVAREQLWNGNRETLATTFSRDSVVLWAMKTHPQRRKEFPILLKQPEYAHLTAIHLRSPKAAQDWISRLKP